MEYLLLVVGFLLLVKCADFFVSGSSSVAKKLGVEEFIIGLTLVAFGTSAPELAVSVTASLQEQNEIAISNVLGSNIFNILAVLGISSIILPIKVDKNILSKDLPLSLVAAIATLVMCLDGFLEGSTTTVVSRGDGLILLLLFSIFLYYTISYSVNNKNIIANEEICPLPLWKSLLLIGIGLIGIVMGGKLVVYSATIIASDFGVSETIIGLTIVALGTSLPELVTTVVATKKGSADMALGNVVGSNIFNILLILGITSVIDPVYVNTENISDAIILVLITIVLIIMAYTSRKIQRAEGIVLISLLAMYYVFIFVRQ
ncbi:MAG: calcium/sodium antiporter [Lachnospirales bacterium]